MTEQNPDKQSDNNQMEIQSIRSSNQSFNKSSTSDSYKLKDIIIQMQTDNGSFSAKSSNKSFNGSDFMKSIKLNDMNMIVKAPSATENRFLYQARQEVQEIIQPDGQIIKIENSPISINQNYIDSQTLFLNQFENLSIKSKQKSIRQKQLIKNSQLKVEKKYSKQIKDQNQNQARIQSLSPMYDNIINQNSFKQESVHENQFLDKLLKNNSESIQHKFSEFNIKKVKSSQLQSQNLLIPEQKQINFIHSSHQKQNRPNQVHSDDDQYKPNHRNSHHKALNVLIREKIGVGKRIGANNQSNTQKFIKKMHGYHYNKNFQQFYNSRMSQSFKSKRQFDQLLAKDQQKLSRIIDDMIQGLQTYQFTIHKSVRQQVLPRFNNKLLQKFIEQLFEQVFRKTYEIMINTQRRRILKQSQQDQNITSQYLDVKGNQQLINVFDSILLRQDNLQYYQLLVNSHFQTEFKIQLPKIKLNCKIQFS